MNMDIYSRILVQIEAVVNKGHVGTIKVGSSRLTLQSDGPRGVTNTHDTGRLLKSLGAEISPFLQS